MITCQLIHKLDLKWSSPSSFMDLMGVWLFTSHVTISSLMVAGWGLSYADERSDWGMFFCLSEPHQHPPLIWMLTHSRALNCRLSETPETAVASGVNMSYDGGVAYPCGLS